MQWWYWPLRLVGSIGNKKKKKKKRRFMPFFRNPKLSADGCYRQNKSSLLQKQMKAANSTVSDDDDDDDDDEDSKLVSNYFTLACRFNLFDLLNAHESHLSPTNSRK